MRITECKKKKSLDVKNHSIIFFSLIFFFMRFNQTESCVFLAINNYRTMKLDPMAVRTLMGFLYLFFFFHFSRIMNVFSLFGVLIPAMAHFLFMIYSLLPQTQSNLSNLYHLRLLKMCDSIK